MMDMKSIEYFFSPPYALPITYFPPSLFLSIQFLSFLFSFFFFVLVDAREGEPVGKFICGEQKKALFDE